MGADFFFEEAGADSSRSTRHDSDLFVGASSSSSGWIGEQGLTTKAKGPRMFGGLSQNETGLRLEGEFGGELNVARTTTT